MDIGNGEYRTMRKSRNAQRGSEIHSIIQRKSSDKLKTGVIVRRNRREGFHDSNKRMKGNLDGSSS